MAKTVLCGSCRKQVAPPIAAWDSISWTLVYHCPECGAANRIKSSTGKYTTLLQEVH